jgi:hypothetical protein
LFKRRSVPVCRQAAGRPLFRNSFTRGSADGSFFFNPFDLTFKARTALQQPLRLPARMPT